MVVNLPYDVMRATLPTQRHEMSLIEQLRPVAEIVAAHDATQRLLDESLAVFTAQIETGRARCRAQAEQQLTALGLSITLLAEQTDPSPAAPIEPIEPIETSVSPDDIVESIVSLAALPLPSPAAILSAADELTPAQQKSADEWSKFADTIDPPTLSVLVAETEEPSAALVAIAGGDYTCPKCGVTGPVNFKGDKCGACHGKGIAPTKSHADRVREGIARAKQRREEEAAAAAASAKAAVEPEKTGKVSAPASPVTPPAVTVPTPPTPPTPSATSSCSTESGGIFPPLSVEHTPLFDAAVATGKRTYDRSSFDIHFDKEEQSFDPVPMQFRLGIGQSLAARVEFMGGKHTVRLIGRWAQ